MKSLKLLVLVLLGATIGFSSCEQLGLTPTSDDNSAVFDLLFLATADSSVTGGHHGHGGPKGKGGGKMTQIDVTSLPSNVTSYISTNYVGSTVKHAAKTDSGYYAVHIVLTDSTHKGLLFDASGNFLREKSGKGHKGTSVDVASLPSAIATYVSANYAGSTITKAMVSSEGKYGVLVTKSDDTKVLLGFDSAGAFLNELTPKQGGKHGKGK